MGKIICSFLRILHILSLHKPRKIIWSKIIGSPEFERGYFVNLTHNNNILVLGEKITEYQSFPDVYLIMMNNLGDTLWSKVYGGSCHDYGNCIQETDDGGFVVVGGTTCSFGNGNNDIYLITTYLSGDTLWTRTFGGTDDEFGVFVREMDNGDFIIYGSTKSFGNGNSDFYLIKTDSDGNKLWSKTYGSEENETPTWGN